MNCLSSFPQALSLSWDFAFNSVSGPGTATFSHNDFWSALLLPMLLRFCSVQVMKDLAGLESIPDLMCC